jgi:acetyl-CoA carboxylase biotin carboxyl carrier protein
VFELTNRDLAALLEAVNESRITSFHLKTPQFEVSISCLEDGAVAERPIVGQAPPAPAEPADAGDVAVASPSVDPAADVGGGQAQEPQLGTVAVTAPMVGAFYVAPEPGAPPYVEPGSTVTPETTIGLIEAMKVFTAVTAGVHGVVAAVLAENGDFVEYGQDLVLVAPSDEQSRSVDEDVRSA